MEICFFDPSHLAAPQAISPWLNCLFAAGWREREAMQGKTSRYLTAMSRASQMGSWHDILTAATSL